MKLSVIIPCYNEEKNIPLLFSRVKELNLDKNKFEVIFVNNGSNDQSATIFESFIDQFPQCKLINVEKNIGYGHGICSGLQSATGDFIGWTHADLQTDLGDIVRAYHILEKQNFDSQLYIKGKRFGRPLFDRFFTFGMSIFESLFLGQWLYDINAQPNIFPKQFFQSIKDMPDDFSLDLYFYYLALKAKMKINRFPVLFAPRQHGTSHWNTSFSAKWKFIKRTLAFSKEMKKRLK